MLNVLVQQFELISLLAYFHAEKIAHREHSHPALTVNNRKMPAADQLHTLESLVRRFVTLNHSPQLAGHVSNLYRVWIPVSDDNTIHDVALGKHAQQLAAFINHTDSAYIPRRHELRSFLHSRRGRGRVRLTVANHFPDQHRSCLLFYCGVRAL